MKGTQFQACKRTSLSTWNYQRFFKTLHSRTAVPDCRWDSKDLSFEVLAVNWRWQLSVLRGLSAGASFWVGEKFL
jgi:hypothetical protein